MPFNFGQLFVRDPYNNEIDPSTGMIKRPSIWQSIAWPEDSSRLRHDIYSEKMAEANYSPIQVSGQTVTQPTARQSFWNPAWSQAYQQQLLAPIEDVRRLGFNEALSRQAMGLEQEFNPVKIKMERERLENTASALEDIHHKQAVTTVTLARKMGLIPPEYANASDDEIATLAKNEPGLNSLLNTFAEGNQITAGLPKLQADLHATQARLAKLDAEEEIRDVEQKHGVKRSGYASELAQNQLNTSRLQEENRLGVGPNLARQAAFSSMYGFPAADLGNRRAMYPVTETGVTEQNDPFFASAIANKIKDMQALTGELNKSPLAAGVEAAGYGKVRPTIGYTGDIVRPSAIDYGPPTLATQISRPSGIDLSQLKQSPQSNFVTELQKKQSNYADLVSEYKRRYPQYARYSIPDEAELRRILGR